MSNSRRLTPEDRHTIRMALNYAAEDREGLAAAYSGVGEQAENAMLLVRRFEKLHEKMFGEKSHRQSEKDRFSKL